MHQVLGAWIKERFAGMSKVHLSISILLLLGIGIFGNGCDWTAPERALKPTPRFEYNPSEGAAPLQVRFNDMSLSAKSPVQAWSWNFGDGNTGSGPSPMHEYKLPGVYDVKLTITTADGNFTVRKKKAVTVVGQDGTTGTGPGETGGTASTGVSITAPQGLPATPIFNVRKEATPMALPPYENLARVSDTYTILHNLPTSDVFIPTANTPVGTSLSIPLHSGTNIPEGQGTILLLARFEDGRVIPIPGSVKDNIFQASVLRIPPRAQYTVVSRPDVVFRGVDGLNVSFGGWLSPWSIATSDAMLRTVTALYKGNMNDEASFNRRNFTATELEDSLKVLSEIVRAECNNYLYAAAALPLLLPVDEKFLTILFPMRSSYSPAISRATGAVYSENFFGHLVLDPEQLVAITIRNLRAAKADSNALDVNQRFSPSMAFVEALARCVYPAYRVAPIATSGFGPLELPVPADGKPVEFMQGFYDGGAIYLGQRAAALGARGFDPNEYSLLSEPLFFPYSAFLPGYSCSSQEFFAWLMRDQQAITPHHLYAKTISGMNKKLDACQQAASCPLNFWQALSALYLQTDDVMSAKLADAALPGRSNLRDCYWLYVKDRAYENRNASLLRPSDNLKPTNFFNAERFGDEGLVHVQFDGPAETLTLAPESTAALRDMRPLSARALVFDLHPMTTELTLTVDPTAWAEDEDGYGIGFAVCVEGLNGIDLNSPKGVYANYAIEDADGDGRNDRVRVTRLESEHDECLNRVIVLAANLNLTERNSLTIEAKASSNLSIPESEVLTRYVSACDPLYDYSLDATWDLRATDGFTAHLLRMTSGAWRGANEVYESVWEHNITVIEPVNIRENTAMLFISGGRTGSEINLTEALILAEFAKQSRSMVALIAAVPNQPLYFSDETRGRSEDAIIAYSYDRYMTGYAAGEPDMTWPALLPMTRAAVRALDTLQDFMANKPGAVRNIDSFVVAGASKRGWTTWLTAAADPRVSAVIPIVIDVLNMDKQMEHHRKAYASYEPFSDKDRIFGGYSTSIKDYVEMEIFSRFNTDAGASLLAIVDPYQYRHKLTMPKLIANSTGDQFFLPDSSQFYFDNMFGENYLHYAPNTDHSLTDGINVDRATLDTMQAFYTAHVRNMNNDPSDNVALPAYTWEYVDSGNRARIVVRADRAPIQVNLWTADAPNHRDFRLQTLGPAWTSVPLLSECERLIELGEDVDCLTHPQRNTYVGAVDVPAEGEGWRGFFVQLRFQGPDGPLSSSDYVFTTPVRVMPDVYPE